LGVPCVNNLDLNPVYTIERAGGAGLQLRASLGERATWMSCFSPSLD
jgi:hypothetical protein